MSLDRHIVRLMAATILAIIAYVAPSSVQAHEGHAHHGHYVAATQPKVALPAARVSVTTPAETAVWSEVPTRSKIALPLAVADDAHVEPIGDDC